MRDPRAAWWAGAALLAGVILLAGWLGVISPALEDTARTEDRAEAVELGNAGHEARVAQLTAEQERIGELQAELAELRRQFPTSLELAAFAQRVADLSWRSGAVVESVERAQPVPVVTAAAAEGEAGADEEPADALFRVEITLAVSGSYEEQLQYIGDLQGIDDRLLLVTGVDGIGAEQATVRGSTFVFLPPGGTAATAAGEDGVAS